jgi:hypothetical protein
MKLSVFSFVVSTVVGLSGVHANEQPHLVSMPNTKIENTSIDYLSRKMKATQWLSEQPRSKVKASFPRNLRFAIPEEIKNNPAPVDGQE